jgi:alkanesulfonate monooxygenase SsuD/methylene tetrahydromethanopterin reductase-like flavin-dependent oxidoreductase (luciferase family)
MPPPTKNREWSADEREMVAAKLGAAIVGGQERVAARLNEFLEQTQADELIVVSNTYDFKDRLRSYELLAELTKQTDDKTALATAVRT